MIAELLLAGLCLCGEAPERANDFFWENDRVGFRAYGPGDVHKWSGNDVFNKCVSTNIVVHWLRHRSSPNFHLNQGHGMDDYAVGPGRGVGGVALRKDGKWLPDYGNWIRYRILTNCDERCVFELDYKLPIGGEMTLAVELVRGTSFFHEVVRFSSDVPLDGVEVAVGIDTNAERKHRGDLFVDEKAGIVSLFEDPHLDKDGRPVKGEEGSMMSAIRAVAGDYGIVEGPCGETMLLGKRLPRRKLDGRPIVDVLVGADWTEAGRFRTAAAWHDYVRSGVERTSKTTYLDLMETAVSAYSDERLESYLAEVERDGVQEHGFPRLAANLGVLVANGRSRAKLGLLKRMMDACCRDVAKVMPPKSGGNEFSVKELVEAVVALERAESYPKEVTDGWRKSISSLVAEVSYTTGRLKVGEPVARNWVVFAAASEQARLAHGMGGDPKFVEKYVKDQLRWFDANGMYKDPNQPAVYDFVTRLQFMHILDWGYDGPSRAALEAQLEKSAEPTLRMLSACGEIPYGGRSNQFLHNNTFYAAVCEWYAAHRKDERFRQAAREAVAALRPWLDEKPVSHVKNRYPLESDKGVFNPKPDMGCESYAYFDKYMVTMGSWAMSARSFVSPVPRSNIPHSTVQASPSVFVTTPDFHFVFLSAGDYSAQFDYNADVHYDCDGLGRVQRRGAPAALCLSTPCAKVPSYRVETPNDAPLAIAPVGSGDWTLKPGHCFTEGPSAVAKWLFVPALSNQTIKQSNNSNNLLWTCSLTAEGLSSTQTGDGPVALSLPAFAFDGKEEARISAEEKSLTVAYRGWKCVYETDGAIVDTGRSACNRNGRYRRFEARGERNLKVTVKIERD